MCKKRKALKKEMKENESFLEEGKNEVQELLKEAMGWDDLSYDEQRQYLKDHPASKKHITSFPKLDYREFLKVKGNDVITDTNNIKLTIPEFEKMNVSSSIRGSIGKLLMDKGVRLSQIFGNDDLYTDGNDIVLGDKTIGQVGKLTFNDIAKKVNKKPYDAEMAAKAKKKKDYLKKLRLYGAEPDDVKKDREQKKKFY